VEKLIQGELAKIQKGWGDDADAKKIRAQIYGKGELAGAHKAIDGLANADLKTQLQGEVEAAFAHAVRAVTFLQGEGRWDDARVKASALSREVTGVDEWAKKSAELLATFDTPEGKKELEASQRLAKVEKQIANKKLRAKDGSAGKALKEAAKASEGTKAAERALMLASVMAVKLSA
jgi:hypothetical protein